MTAAPPRPAAFLDRDGTLNVDVGYAHRPDQITWMPGAVAALRRLNAAGWWVFVVTNQAGVAYGLYDEAAVVALHDWMTQDLARQGARVDGFFYCPHHPTRGRGRYRVACDCRKPAPGLLRQAIDAWPVAIAPSFIVGDKPGDVEAGAALGIRGALYAGGDLDALVAELMAEAGPARAVGTDTPEA